jgi:tRNA(fMet)-specific endonuclease VapC
MRIILDTSAYVQFKRADPKVMEIIARSQYILFSVIVIGELMFGFRSSSKYEESMKMLTSFLDHERVSEIYLTPVTADRYSRIATQLKKEGSPIPTNDIWIAAQTMETGSELITYDRHFENIKGLAVSILQNGDSTLV